MWKPIKANGIDSYVGGIAIDDKDTLRFDLGWYSDKLYEEEQAIMDNSMMGKIDINYVDTSVMIFVKDRMKVDPDQYKKTIFFGI